MGDKMELFKGSVPIDKVSENFIGRDDAFRSFVKLLGEHLREPGQQIILIIGSSGVGKTSCVNALIATGEDGKYPENWSSEWENFGEKDKFKHWLYFSFRTDRLQHEADFWMELYKQLADPNALKKEIKTLSYGEDWEDTLRIRAAHFKKKVEESINPDNPVVLFLDEVDVIHESKNLWDSKKEALSQIGEALAALLQKGLLLVLVSPLPFDDIEVPEDKIYKKEVTERLYPVKDNPLLESLKESANFYIIRLVYAGEENEKTSVKGFAEKRGYEELGEALCQFLAAPHMFYFTRFVERPELLKKLAVDLLTKSKRPRPEDVEALWNTLLKYGRHQWDWVWDQLDEIEKGEVIELIEAKRFPKSEKSRDRLYAKALITKEARSPGEIDAKEGFILPLLMEPFSKLILWRPFLHRKGWYVDVSRIGCFGFLLLVVGAVGWLLGNAMGSARWAILPFFLGVWLFFGSFFQLSDDPDVRWGVIIFAFSLCGLFFMLSFAFDLRKLYTMSMVFLVSNTCWLIDGIFLGCIRKLSMKMSLPFKPL